jgi:hypothetical protein
LGNARSLRGDEAAMRLMDEIEQPTLLSMVNASAMIHRAKETVDCLESLRSAPWWTRPWPDRPSGAQSRVYRDPRGFLPHEPGITSAAEVLWITQGRDAFLLVPVRRWIPSLHRRTGQDSETEKEQKDRAAGMGGRS